MIPRAFPWVLKIRKLWFNDSLTRVQWIKTLIVPLVRRHETLITRFRTHGNTLDHIWFETQYLLGIIVTFATSWWILRFSFENCMNGRANECMNSFVFAFWMLIWYCKYMQIQYFYCWIRFYVSIFLKNPFGQVHIGKCTVF